MSDVLNVAGQYSIDAIEIIQANGLAIDVRDQVNHITIYEDMFSPFMSGNLIMVDSTDLPSYFLNAGTDILHLKLYTPTIDKKLWIDRYFHIYKLSDTVDISDRGQTYIYHFVAIENLLDTTTTISKTYRGPGDAIVQKLVKETLKSTRPVTTAAVANDVNYTSNLWCPTRNIAYIADHSLSSDRIPSFMFYENRTGFQFQPLTSIAKSDVYMKFDASDYVADVKKGNTKGAGTMTRNLEKDYSTILKAQFDLTFDYERDRSNGMLSTRMFTFDLTAKKLSDTTFNMNSDTHSLMNPNRFYTKTVIDSSYNGPNSSVMMFNQRHNALYNNTKDVSDFAYRQKRISILRQYQQHKIEITVFGRTDYSVGMTVDVDINRMQKLTREMSSSQIPNPLVSGKYIVSAVCHRFGRDGKHETTMELIRDSINKNV